MTIGQRIKKRRLEMGLTVDELAEKLNKNRATVYRYESSEIENLPTTVLEPLAKALDTTPGYFMGWDNEDKSPENEKDTPTDMEREFFNKIHDLHLKPSQLSPFTLTTSCRCGCGCPTFGRYELSIGLYKSLYPYI